MKTKISLSILGLYNTLMGLIMMFFASAIGNEIVLSENTDALKWANYSTMGCPQHY